ncbi:hypothetical protein [Chitinibacter tainanensis]|uniref:hypothetical protein n=1 Tax=Chitinibacter tainanensis TaxID=230667 RepID=UPI00235529E8|nr:hypothetical protein [Chitinibacter tainanensis]
MLDWTEKLESVIPKPCYQRPFVCKGLPSDCEVIIIGENPATKLSIDWWSFWNTKTGFDFDAFEMYYMEERKKIGKYVSNTRLRLNRIRERGVKCMETNAFCNERLDGAGDGVPNYDVLKTLIHGMPKIRAIVAHGQKAHKYIRSATIPEKIQIFEVRHFSRVSFANIDDLCTKLLCDVE